MEVITPEEIPEAMVRAVEARQLARQPECINWPGWDEYRQNIRGDLAYALALADKAFLFSVVTER